MHTLLYTLLDESGKAAKETGGGGLQMILMMGLIVAVFYFFMIRPQQKKQRAEREFRASLGKGDKVMTIGGIHGKIVSTDDHTILVEVDNAVKLKLDKSAVRAAPDYNQEANKKK